VTSGSDYRIIADELPARISGVWAKEKLYYVQRYMSIFNGGMKKLWSSRTYLDLLAGCGRNVLKDSAEEFDGSPLIALACKPAFSEMLFVEQDPDLAAALQARVVTRGGRPDMVVVADANAPMLATMVHERFSPHALGLMFVDCLGMEIELKTIARLAKGRKMDLLLTFQVNDLTRNVPLALKGEQDPERIDRFFGTTGWREVAARFDLAEIASPDLGAALTDFYCEQLKTIGYTHVEPHKRLMRNTVSAPLYRLILAAKHARAIEFFQKISQIESHGQRGLAFD
jgi:three-Cys-motif partner protein